MEVKDYSPVKEKVQTTYQNTYFNERFGRSDFKEVNEHVLSEAVRYIMKYLEKDGGRIVYSRGLPQIFHIRHYGRRRCLHHRARR